MRLVVDINEDVARPNAALNCVFAELSEELEVITIPWKRGQLGTKTGLYDGFYLAAQTHERDVYAVHSEPFYQIKWIYVQRADNFLTANNLDFYEQKFTTTRGTRRLVWLRKELAKYNAGKQITISNTPTTSISYLKSKQVDVALSNEESFNKALIDLNLKRGDFHTEEVLSIPGAVYFSKGFLAKSPSFIDRFNAAVPDCRNKYFSNQ